MDTFFKPLIRIHSELGFVLAGKPFSINAISFRDKRHKTPEARLYESQIMSQLVEVARLYEIAEQWRKNGGFFILELDAYYPENVFYTGSGEISGRTVDVTNYEKQIQDLIFKVMGLNDKLVKRVVSEKHVGTHAYISVSIKLAS